MNIQRIPRPIGLTLQLKEIRKTNDIKEKKKCLHYIIAQGFVLNGKVIDLHQTSQLLGLPLKTIIGEFSKGLKHFDLGKNDMASFYREGLNFAFFGILEDRIKIKAQEEMLVRAQGGQYVPFLTQQVNQAQNNLLNSQKGIFSVLDKMGSYMTLQLQAEAFKAKGEDPTPTEGSQYLTLVDALKMLESSTVPIALVHENLTKPENLPSIIAHRENSYALQKEALDVNNASNADEPSEPIKRKIRHIERNEANNAHILTDEDFEDDAYEDFSGS